MPGRVGATARGARAGRVWRSCAPPRSKTGIAILNRVRRRPNAADFGRFVPRSC